MVKSQKISFRIYDGKEKGDSWTENLEICYVLQGRGTLAVAGKGKWKIQEDDIFVMNMYETYQLLLESNGAVLSLQIPASFALNLYPEFSYKDVACLSFLIGRERQGHFEKIREYMADIFAVYCKNLK